MSRRGLIVRHTPHEGIAGFRLPVEQAGFALDRIDVTDPDFPSLDFAAPDLLILMGGPMGVYEADAHPWIARELAGIAARLERGLPTLGVCLGAQMIASALGARVYPGPAKEVGFGEVALNAAGARSPLRHVAGVPLLHWHGDTFDPPPGTETLAATALYAQQAFRRGRHLLALQFHPEMGEDERFGEWLDGGGDCVAAAGTTPDALRRDYAALGPAAAVAGRKLIAEWLAGLAG